MAAYSAADLLALMTRPVEVEKPDLRPLIVVPMCPVPDGKMPKAAQAVVTSALEADMKVWSTYAMAFVPNVLRAGTRIVLTLETVVVRMRRPEVRIWASWHNGRFRAAQSMIPGRLPVDRGARDLGKLISDWQTVKTLTV